jgi:hypothetical protein
MIDKVVRGKMKYLLEYREPAQVVHGCRRRIVITLSEMKINNNPTFSLVYIKGRKTYRKM